MPSLKLKRLTTKSPVDTEQVKVRLKVKPKPNRDNVITSPPVKVRPRPNPAVDTSPVDAAAKAYNIALSTGDNRTIKGFVVTALDILGTTGVTATRWVKSGMLPKPIFETGRGAIYHIEEVRSFYRLLTEHQRSHRQYRAEHADLRQSLFSENARIRRGLFPTK